jgi:predicted  nucleic acid-binding Zn-ribbon protein
MINTIRVCAKCGTLIQEKDEKGDKFCTWCGCRKSIQLKEESKMFRQRNRKGSITEKIVPYPVKINKGHKGP